MKSFGNVYLLEWRETIDVLKLSDYTQDVTKVLKSTEDTHSGSVNLVGMYRRKYSNIFDVYL